MSEPLFDSEEERAAFVAAAKGLEPNAAREVAYMMDHGTSPQAEAARTLQRFMCCKAGEDLVEHGLLRPFGYSLEPGRVMTAYRLLKDTLESVEAHVAGEAQELHDGRTDAERSADALAQISEYIRRQVAKADASL